MLSAVVRNNFKNVEELKLRTKATKFSDLFQGPSDVTIEESSLDEILEKCNLKNYVKKEDKVEDLIEEVKDEVISDNLVSDSEIEDYIVENPNEVIVQFPIPSNIELKEKLPFFKSLSLKLANL